jgi:hypothetical protein
MKIALLSWCLLEDKRMTAKSKNFAIELVLFIGRLRTARLQANILKAVRSAKTTLGLGTLMIQLGMLLFLQGHLNLGR